MTIENIRAYINSKLKLTAKTGELPELINVFMLMRFIGITAILLPIIVHGWYFVTTGQMTPLGSVSEYYHTSGRDIFVGLLCAIGVFMIVYKGFANLDNIVSTIGGISAIGIAFCPTGCEGLYSYCKELCGANWCDKQTVLHFVFAAILFTMLAVFCFYLFTNRTDKTDRSYDYNPLYRRSGWIIIACMILIFVYSKLLGSDTKEGLAFFRPIFWLEAIGLMTFGFSWLTKAHWLKNVQMPIVRAKE